MKDSGLTDFLTWWLDHRDCCFRYWVYKKVFTPYEQRERFSDESMFEDSFASNGYIKEAVELPDGDVLLGIESASAEDYIEYFKLSEIRLAYTPNDVKEYPEYDYDDEEIFDENKEDSIREVIN